jgi:putative methionine-R-sulfoxide reductase with GAF domain
MFKKISIFWIVLIALMFTSAFPLSFVAIRAIQTAERGIENEQRNQLVARVDAHATAINELFQKFQVATSLAAAQAKELLVTDAPALTEAQVSEKLAKYQREAKPGGDDKRYTPTNPYVLGVYGLDNWYKTTYLPKYNDDKRSDAFLNNKTELTPWIGYTIAATEELDALWESIKAGGIGTQWIYLTTAEGMIRLYPWSGNEGYDVNWEPQTQIFYTAADAANDPQRKPVWTKPYNDFAGAGVMVTNSVPIYNGDKLVAVMSHDYLIRDLQSQVLGFKVGESGFAFLIDKDGNIVAHKDYDPKDTPLGQELSIKLGEKDLAMAPVVNSMLKDSGGITNYIDPKGNEWTVVFAQIPLTDWHLGMMQLRSEIIQPAIDIRDQFAPVASLLVLAVILISVFVARGIARPIRHLTSAAEQIEATVDEETEATASTESLARISGTSETSRLVTVFSQMVVALKRRMNELSSIYAIGQTITSNVDYDKTLQAVLSAMRQVVDYDAAEIAVVENDELVVRGWWGRGNFRDTTGRTQKIGYGLLGLVASTKTPIFEPVIRSIEDVQQKINQPEFDGRLLIESGLKSLIGIPLIFKDQLIGVLMLVHRTPGHFTEDDRRQLVKLSAQASVAISNATQVRQRESALKQQIHELQIEIDETKKSKAVSEIVESDFFRDLQRKAETMRARTKPTSKPGAQSEEEKPGESKSEASPPKTD